MDKQQLAKELTPFCNEFASRYPTETICLLESWQGIQRTTYTLMIVAPQLPDSNYYPALSDAVDMLWKKQILRHEYIYLKFA